jgi:hypothetical protein
VTGQWYFTSSSTTASSWEFNNLSFWTSATAGTDNGASWAVRYVPLIAEQELERLRMHAQRQVEQELARQEEAERRAEALLRRQLNDVQVAEFDRDRCFTVLSRDGQRCYLIRKGHERNIECLDSVGQRLHRLCAHPQAYLPDYDHMLAQKLALEADEDAFLRLANRS